MNGHEIARVAADRAHDRMMALRQAEIDTGPYTSHLRTSGLALDSAEAIYRNALVDGCGIPASDIKGLPASALEILLKHQPVPGLHASRGAPAIAMDANEASPGLRSILAGVRAPRDLTSRSERRR